MNIPDTIKVAGHTVRVVNGYTFKDAHDLAGQADFATNEIRLAKSVRGTDVCDDVLAATFIHEVLHHISYRFCNDCLDEDMVTMLAEGVYQVFKDNNLVCGETAKRREKP